MLRRFLAAGFLAVLFSVCVWAALPGTDAFTCGSPACSLSGSWTTTFAGAAGTATLNIPVTTGQASTAGTFQWGFAEFAGSTTDQYAQATWVEGTASNSGGPCVRMGANADGYCVIGNSSTCNVNKQSSGASSFLFLCGGTPTNGQTVKLQMVGTTLTVIINGVTLNSSTDATYASGLTGMTVLNSNSATRDSLSSFTSDCIPTCAAGNAGSAKISGPSKMAGPSKTN